MKKLVKLLILLFLLLFSSCKDDSGKVEKLYLAAIDEYTQQEFGNAMKYIDMALKHDSSFYQASFLKCRIFFMTGEYEKSKKIAAKLVRKYPEYTDARLWYIRNLIYTDDFETAEELLQKELSFNMSDWRVFYLYSLLQGKKGQLDKQLAMLSRAELVLKDSGKVYDSLGDIWELLEVDDKVVNYRTKGDIISSYTEY